MWSDRIEIEAEVQALSPLHVGTGETASMSESRRGPDGEEIRPEYALTMTDHKGWPCIPGSTLKGALKAAAEGRGNDLLGLDAAIFGAVRMVDGKETFTARRVTFRTALMRPASATASATRGREAMASPHRSLGPMSGRGMEIVARTAIDSGLGVAEKHKLFHQQVAAPGARFILRLRLDLAEPVDLALGALAALLSPLLAEEGLPVGGGATAGRGRMRLDETSVKATRRRARRGDEDLSDELQRRLAPPESAAWRIRLRLTCDGPFAVLDPAASGERAKHVAGSEAAADPHLAPLAGSNGAPVLPGESLMGALRSEATWMARLENKAFPKEDLRFTPLKPGETPGNWIETLFGRPGWRGLLHVARIDSVRRGERRSFPSVKLDRFSGAPIDGGLFFTEAFVGPVFEVVLELRPRGQTEVDEENAARLARLTERLEANGLELGHGASKGFGWFRVEAL